VADGGNVGIGTTTPGSLLSLGNTGNDTINISTTATSTFGSGLNIRSGCYAINGTCISGGGSSSSASTTLLSDNNTFSGTNYFSGATSFDIPTINYRAGEGGRSIYAYTYIVFTVKVY